MPATRAVRCLEALAALLSAGLVVLGLALAVLVVAAPALVGADTATGGVVGGTGDLLDASGPRLDRVLVQLIVGLLGELLRYQRSRLPERARPVMAAAVVVAGLGALWWGWWR